MIDVVLLRFDAPAMSFGGVVVDNRGVTLEYPGVSALAGLCANALGWDHRDTSKTQALQDRIRMAARRDRAGRRLRDFQTVDLSQSFLIDGWTTRGAREGREGGSAREATHIRSREFVADAAYTIALSLDPARVAPTLDDVAAALRDPERPLFLGRKSCLPAGPIFLAQGTFGSLVDALASASRAKARGRASETATMRLWWPDDGKEPQRASARRIEVADLRDWRNQVHTGSRFIFECDVPAPDSPTAASPQRVSP